MLIEVFEAEINGNWKNVIATKESFAEAKVFVEAMGVAFMDEDEDYENCADAYLNDGRIIAIQPVDFEAA
jgi:hypothetical protein